MKNKTIGNIQSERKLETRIINKKSPYIEILLLVIILLLFIIDHFLITIAYVSSPMLWFGFEVTVLIIDVTLFSAILLSFILLILIINRNFTFKKKK